MKITISSDGQRMSNGGFHRVGGLGAAGRDHGPHMWWLRGPGGFVDVASVRGDYVFEAEIDLEPGRYVLGTGRGRDRIRVEITVEDVSR